MSWYHPGGLDIVSWKRDPQTGEVTRADVPPTLGMKLRMFFHNWILRILLNRPYCVFEKKITGIPCYDIGSEEHRKWLDQFPYVIDKDAGDRKLIHVNQPVSKRCPEVEKVDWRRRFYYMVVRQAHEDGYQDCPVCRPDIQAQQPDSFESRYSV